MQMVFGRDTILNTKFIADWDYIRQCKQQIINTNNIKENSRRVSQHTYRVGDKVLIKVASNTKYNSPEYEGPYLINTAHANGTVWVQKNKYYEIVNIRNIKPYQE